MPPENAGVLTEEMSAEVDREDFQERIGDLFDLGRIVGLAFAIASPLSKSKLPLRIIAGLVLGLAWRTSSGLYLQQIISLFGTTTRLWIILFDSLERRSFAMIAALGISVTLASWNPKNLIENIVRIGVGSVIAICIYVFSMGLVTPIEQAQYIFPGFKVNSALLMASSHYSFFHAFNSEGWNADTKAEVSIEPTLNNAP